MSVVVLFIFVLNFAYFRDVQGRHCHFFQSTFVADKSFFNIFDRFHNQSDILYLLRLSVHHFSIVAKKIFVKKEQYHAYFFFHIKFKFN